ncbi:MAG: glycosyltransferase family 2 protein [Actinomycetota bacterium]|nr:glycosyltransferase family 2 protein [Actinomycetota bacterium]
MMNAEGRQEPAVEVSVLMPCLDEAAAVGDCVEEALKALAEMGVQGEVIVVDNGSTDDSARMAEEAGARVVYEPRRGYGNAYLRALREARGRYLVFGDADGTYDFSAIPAFIEPLSSGADLVMGSRFEGHIQPGAMPWLHRYLGSPLFTAIVNRIFRTQISDLHCGMRSLAREASSSLRLRSPGMEFASELVIEAARRGLVIEEVPIAYRRRQGGEPKLRTWRDGWRHLCLILSEARQPAMPPAALLDPEAPLP